MKCSFGPSVIYLLLIVIICFMPSVVKDYGQPQGDVYKYTIKHKVTISNGHFPSGKLSYGEHKRLIIEGLPNTCRIKLSEGYHILYGGLFINGKKVRNYGGETILKQIVGGLEKEYFADNRIDGYHIIDTHPLEGELKLVIIKPVLDNDGFIQWTDGGSIVSESISPKNVIVDIIEDSSVNKHRTKEIPEAANNVIRWKEIIGPATVQNFDVQYTDCPIHIKTQDGHVFCVARYKDGMSFKGFILAISEDCGETFRYKQFLLSKYPFGDGDYPTLVFDENKKNLFLFSNNKYVISSTVALKFKF